MFLDFFYLLRSHGLKVSMNEWMTLMEALYKGLHGSSLTGFYHVSRAILVKTEADFDKFDRTFLEFFQDVPWTGPVPEEFLSWLNKPKEDLGRDFSEMMKGLFPDEDMAELLKSLEAKIKEQDAEHNGGSKWVGTQGFTPWGNSGWHPNGLRIGGEGQYKTAMSVAGERKYRDFRTDQSINIRQYQMAFRKLRSFSTQDIYAQKVLDLDGTIDDTCENAGTLKLRYKNPRKNAVKVLLLIDSGGSMDWYAKMCNTLFNAATKSNYFKELHIYYFHNCIYQTLYTDPHLLKKNSVPTDWVFNNFGSEYKVIIVGDAAMNPYELFERRYDWMSGKYDDQTGLQWLSRLKNQYPYTIWLNPEPMPTSKNFWSQTHMYLADMFHMFYLSVDGLEEGIKRLMSRSA